MKIKCWLLPLRVDVPSWPSNKSIHFLKLRVVQQDGQSVEQATFGTSIIQALSQPLSSNELCNRPFNYSWVIPFVYNTLHNFFVCKCKFVLLMINKANTAMNGKFVLVAERVLRFQLNAKQCNTYYLYWRFWQYREIRESFREVNETTFSHANMKFDTDAQIKCL